jgi:hypothetical protein
VRSGVCPEITQTGDMRHVLGDVPDDLYDFRHSRPQPGNAAGIMRSAREDMIQRPTVTARRRQLRQTPDLRLSTIRRFALLPWHIIAERRAKGL